MLVLTRKTQQQIQIGDSITITILRVKGNSVRVGIDAPRNHRVLRSELNVQVKDVELPEGEDAEQMQPADSGETLIVVRTNTDGPAPSQSPPGRLPTKKSENSPPASMRLVSSPLAARVVDVKSATSGVRAPARLTAASLRGMLK